MCQCQPGPGSWGCAGGGGGGAITASSLAGALAGLGPGVLKAEGRWPGMPVPPLPHPAFNLKFAIYLRLPTSPKVLNPQLPPSRPASSQMLVLISCPWQEKYFKITYITDGWSLHPFQDIYLLSCSKENFKQPLLSALKKREEHWGRGAGPGEFTPSPARPDGQHSCFSFYSQVF